MAILGESGSEGPRDLTAKSRMDDVPNEVSGGHADSPAQDTDEGCTSSTPHVKRSLKNQDIRSGSSILDNVPDEELDMRPEDIVRRQNLLRCAREGMSAREAAKKLGYSYTAVRDIWNDRSFRALCFKELSRAFSTTDEAFLEKKVTLQEKIEMEADRAFEVLQSIYTNEDSPPAVRAKVAQDILDRNPQTQVGHTIRHDKFDPEQLQKAALTAQEMDLARKKGETIQ